MEYRGFTTTMKYSEEDGVFYGKLENTEDIVSFHSETEEDFEDAFKSAVDDYFEFCKDICKKPSIL